MIVRFEGFFVFKHGTHRSIYYELHLLFPILLRHGIIIFATRLAIFPKLPGNLQFYDKCNFTYIIQ